MEFTHVHARGALEVPAAMPIIHSRARVLIVRRIIYIWLCSHGHVTVGGTHIYS